MLETSRYTYRYNRVRGCSHLILQQNAMPPETTEPTEPTDEGADADGGEQQNENADNEGEEGEELLAEAEDDEGEGEDEDEEAGEEEEEDHDEDSDVGGSDISSLVESLKPRLKRLLSEYGVSWKSVETALQALAADDLSEALEGDEVEEALWSLVEIVIERSGVLVRLRAMVARRLMQSPAARRIITPDVQSCLVEILESLDSVAELRDAVDDPVAFAESLSEKARALMLKRLRARVVRYAPPPRVLCTCPPHSHAHAAT